MIGEKEAGEKTEREDLPFMGMPRKLEIRDSSHLFIDQRPVLQEKRKASFRKGSDRGCDGPFPDRMPPKPLLVIDAGQGKPAVHVHPFALQNGEAGPFKPFYRPFQADVEFMVSRDGVLTEGRIDLTERGQLRGERIRLAVDQITRADQEVGFRFQDG